ncbi:HD domain-containing protein [Pseudonocardia oceani]|uniref:HD domain-containing protein n=1 Tax=Pseudonocardia oceani TaxID=2792013 RepID=UPI001C49E00B|nr:HD domain-containing protein [Pseudonocardia oceani]
MEWAESTAEQFLKDSLPRRWAHVQSVAGRAGRLVSHLGRDGEILHATAWLHDVGYAPPLAVTGFHPLDGAHYLQTVDVPARVVDLVALHSSAAAEASALDLDEEMAGFVDERTLTRDLLWFVDMTIGPDGQCMDFEARMDDVRARYVPDHYVIRALDAGMAERRAAMARASEWIDSVGIADQV